MKKILVKGCVVLVGVALWVLIHLGVNSLWEYPVVYNTDKCCWEHEDCGGYRCMETEFGWHCLHCGENIER